MGYQPKDGRPPDALIIVPPPSPSETNPPLGPAILASSAAEHGLTVAVVDLNISYISAFHGKTMTRQALALGDHGKDRALLAAAFEQFFQDTALRSNPPLHLPDTADPAAGMHVGFSALESAVAQALDDRTPWLEWLEAELFEIAGEPPPVLGISVMGPSQVFLAAVILALAKQRWPGTTTVVGGSHVTLLADRIGQDERYRRDIDIVLPGHSEGEFVRLLLARGLGKPAMPPRQNEEFPYLPYFTADYVSLFDRNNLAIPLQFTRGCAYGRCTFCTYPVVEPLLTAFDAGRATRAIAELTATHGITRFSVKDSLFTVPMTIALADALIDKGLSIRWSATTKATRGLVPHTARLAASGLATLEIGVETIHPAGQALFDKRADRAMLEDVLLACAESGITVVVNLIFGLPDETPAHADEQLSWFLKLRGKAPRGRIEGSLNMLEIVRGSPLALRPPPNVRLFGVAPWAYCYAWNAPSWRPEYVKELQTAEMLT